MNTEITAKYVKITTAVKYGLSLQDFEEEMNGYEKYTAPRNAKTIKIMDDEIAEWNEGDPWCDTAFGILFTCPKCGEKVGGLMFGEMESTIHCENCGEWFSTIFDEIFVTGK